MKPRGITISVTAETNAGCRRHMEDYLAIKLSPNEEFSQLPHLREQAFIGVFDGHGGKEAAKCARERLWDVIQHQPKYKLSDINSVKESLVEAFVALHEEMEPLRVTWKQNKMGDLSTAGTTVSTVIFRQDHIFIANVGDSTAVLAVNNPLAQQRNQHPVKAIVLTKDHKPEDPMETKNIENLGGSVMISRQGVPRVVWRRPRKFGAEGTFDSIPFLSVSRSLGDFWSFNPRTNHFTVSPKPDVYVHPLNPKVQRFIVIASDGLWNVMSPDEVVQFVWDYEHNRDACHQPRDVVRAIINDALRRWERKNLPADNIAVLIAFLTEASLDGSTSAVVGTNPSSVSNISAGSAVTSPEEGGADKAVEASVSTKVCESSPAPQVHTGLPQGLPLICSQGTSSLLASSYSADDEANSESMHESNIIAQRVHTSLLRSPLNSVSISPIGKHSRVEDLKEALPVLKRCKPDNGLLADECSGDA